MLSQALKLARKRGGKLAVEEYCATRRKGQVRLFYGNNGFEQIDTISNESDLLFH
jgi:hypothetical protein